MQVVRDGVGTLTLVQVPKRIYTLEEMRLNKVEPTALLSPTDETINGIKSIAQVRAFLQYNSHLREPCTHDLHWQHRMISKRKFYCTFA